MDLICEECKKLVNQDRVTKCVVCGKMLCCPECEHEFIEYTECHVCGRPLCEEHALHDLYCDNVHCPECIKKGNVCLYCITQTDAETSRRCPEEETKSCSCGIITVHEECENNAKDSGLLFADCSECWGYICNMCGQHCPNCRKWLCDNCIDDHECKPNK